MTWPLVALTLGLVTLAVAVYALRLWRSMHVAADDLLALKAAAEASARSAEGMSNRLAKLEAALRIDGTRIMAEANKNALPGFMR